MRLWPAPVRVRTPEIDRAVEMQRAIGVDVDVERLEVGRGVDEADLAGLRKIVRDDDVLLVGRNLDVVGSDGRLHLVRVVEALDVFEVGDVEGGDMAACCDACFCGC